MRVEGGEAFALRAGEVVLFPRNDLHLLGSDLDLPPVMARDIIQPPRDGGLFSIHHLAVTAPVAASCAGFWAATARRGTP